MQRNRLRRLFVLLLVSAIVAGAISLSPLAGPAVSQETDPEARRGGGVATPSYDENGHLRLPPDYREWIFVGSSLGMSYTEGAAMGHEMFHETLMEPGAYRAFVDTGEFPDGTQLVLILHGTGESVLPMRRGRFANEIHGVEMAVKDVGRFDEEWAYYGFGGMSGIRPTAEAFPAASCHDCHVEHAALDNVFAQFYPMLTEAAGVEVALRYVGEASDAGPGELSGPMGAAPPAPDAEDEHARAEASGEAAPHAEAESSQAAETTESPSEPSATVAYSGLDPVMLVEGREEMGKAEIIEVYEGWTYQFASEPNRRAFAADPARYAPQNDTCPVVLGAAVSPDLFAVHDGKVYTFASVNCRETFESDPAAYVGEPEPESSGGRELL